MSEQYALVRVPLFNSEATCLCLRSQMETEPVAASEPVFSVAPSVQVPRHVPAIPNGSNAQTKPDQHPEKMTMEQLAAIEDEELLDKMVLCTQDLKAALHNNKGLES